MLPAAVKGHFRHFWNNLGRAGTRLRFFNERDGPGRIAILGNNLLVATGTDGGSVGEYDAATGAVVNATFIDNPQLTGGISGVAVSGDDIFVSNPRSGYNLVGEYDATTGAAINANLITGLRQMGNSD